MCDKDKHEMPKITTIAGIIDENNSMKTFVLKHIGKTKKYLPGQFIMLWLPEIDEKPFSISKVDADTFNITIEKKGHYTEKLFELRSGDCLGVRGPYGNGFDIKDSKSVKSCVIAGGCGTAPVLPLIEKLHRPTVIIGCQNKDRFIYMDKIKDFDLCTDDGSLGHKGFVTEKFKELLKKGKKFDIVYTCGPEPMMKAVFDICKELGIECQASLERFMICGIGICGQCMCDNKRVCKEGPVFNSEELVKLNDFGRYAMIKTGKKVSLKEYYSYRTPYNNK